MSKKPQGLPFQGDSLVEQAEAYVKKNGEISVPRLYEELISRNPSLTREQLPDLVSQLAERGNVEVEDDPPPASSLVSYVRMWERNLPIYVSMTLALSAILVIYAVPADSPLVALRWILGSLFVLFIPGYVAVAALFPEGRELDGIERFALSVGLSLALVPLVGLLLNYTPWGIRLDPIVISLTILTAALALVAFSRQFAMSIENSGLRR